MAHFELQGFISEAAKTVRYLSAERQLSVPKLPVCKWTLRLYFLSSVKCCRVHISSCEGLLLIPLAHLERGFYFSSHFEWLICILMGYIIVIHWLLYFLLFICSIDLSTINFHHCCLWKLLSGVPVIMREFTLLLPVSGVVEWVALPPKNTSLLSGGRSDVCNCQGWLL